MKIILPNDHLQKLEPRLLEMGAQIPIKHSSMIRFLETIFF